MGEQKGETKNVMLTCLSTLKGLNRKNYYRYDFRNETDRSLDGYMTNEAPAKRIVKQLYADHKKRLDRIVMICSDEVELTIAEVQKKNRGFELSEEIREEYGDSIFSMSARTYFESVIKKFAQDIDPCYQKQEIEFRSVGISSFVDQAAVAKAAVESADKVMTKAAVESADEVMKKDYEDINLYIDFNGGPRHIAVLILGIANLMKLRNVNVREITFMDFENKKKEKEGDREVDRVPIESMDAIFGCVDLVSGVNEYINYGRCHLLTEYFRECEDPGIKEILRLLEDFANNMQMCLTDYVMTNKENIKKGLEKYRNPEEKEEKKDVYEVLFSFVAEDILRGCEKLLEGDLPEMILWCVDKGFTQQALTFYKECMPKYFFEKGIFLPTLEERKAYDRWQYDCIEKNVPEGVYRDYCDRYRFMDAEHCWLMHYLPEVEPVRTEKTLLSGETADGDKAEEYEISGIIGRETGQAAKKVRRILAALDPEIHRAYTEVPPEKREDLEQALAEYLLIQGQCLGARRNISELGDAGRLWSYQEMCKVLRKAADRVNRLAKAAGNSNSLRIKREKRRITL